MNKLERNGGDKEKEKEKKEKRTKAFANVELFKYIASFKVIKGLLRQWKRKVEKEMIYNKQRLVGEINNRVTKAFQGRENKMKGDFQVEFI